MYYGDIMNIESKKAEKSQRSVTVLSKKDVPKDTAMIFDYLLNNNDSELSWVLQLINEGDPQILKGLQKKQKQALELASKSDRDVFLFKSNPFESQSPKLNEYIKTLKSAIKKSEYKDIEYFYTHKESLKNCKCLKLVFASGNWYIAIEDSENRFRFLRLSFIKKIEYSKDKFNYQKSTLDKYSSFFKTMQNTFSLPFVEQKRAVLKASPKVAIYFQEGMKPFFESQKFIERLEDGSIIFSVGYSQSLEVLPFVKSWLPNIKVLEPVELGDELQSEIKEYLKTD